MALPLAIGVGALVRRAIFSRAGWAFAARSGSFLLEIGWKIVGWLVPGAANLIKWVSTSVFGNLLAIAVIGFFKFFEYIVNINWNASDAEIDRLIESNNNVIGTRIGEFIGYSVATFTVLGAVFKVPRIGAVIATAAWIKADGTAGEAAEELIEEFKASMRATATTLIQSLTLLIAKGTRGSIKTLANLLPEGAWTDGIKGAIAAWGATSNTPWTVNKAMEEKIEAIDSKFWEGVAEGAWEGFREGATQNGMIVGDELEILIAASRQTRFWGDEQTVTIDTTPDETDSVRGGQLILRGGQEAIVPQIYAAAATHQQIYHRDMGFLIGQPAEDWVANTMLRRTMTITWYKGVERPPWNRNGKRAGMVTVTIPNPRAGLTWFKIKEASRRYTWGRFQAGALLKSGRTIKASGATSDEAQDIVRRLAELSSDELIAINVTEEAQRHPEIKKQPVLVYPARVCLLVRRDATDATGRLDVQGKRWDEVPWNAELWPPTEPDDLTPVP